MQDLPIEIRTKILSQLSLKDFLIFGQSNKHNRKELVNKIFAENLSENPDYFSLQSHYLFSWISAANFLLKDKDYYAGLLKAYAESCALTIEQKAFAYGLLHVLSADNTVLHSYYSNLLSSMKIEDKPLITYLENILDFQLKKSEGLTQDELAEKFKSLFSDKKKQVKNKIFLVNVFKCLDQPIVNKTLFNLIEKALKDLNNNKVKKKSLKTLEILAKDLPDNCLEETAKQLCGDKKALFYGSDDSIAHMADNVMRTILDRLPPEKFKVLAAELLPKISAHIHSSVEFDHLLKARAWESYELQISSILLARVELGRYPATKIVFKMLTGFLPVLPEAEFEKIIKSFLRQLAGNVQTSSSKKVIQKAFARMPDYKKGLPIPLIESVIKDPTNERMFYPLMLLEALGYFAAYFDENNLKNFMALLFPYFYDSKKYLVCQAYEIWQAVIPNLNDKNISFGMKFIHEKLNSPDKAIAIKMLSSFLKKLPENSLKPIIEMLLKSITNEDKNICKASLNIIGQFPEKILKKYFTQIMDAVLDKAASEDARIFLAAIKALSQCSAQIISSQYLDQVIELLLDKAESKTVKVYQSAIAALGKFSTCLDKKYHQRIVKILIDPEKAADLAQLEPLIKGFIQFSFLIDDNHFAHITDVLKKGAGDRLQNVSKTALRGFQKLEGHFENSAIMPIVSVIFRVLAANSKNKDIFQLALDVLMKCLMRLSNEEVEKIKSSMENSPLHSFPESQLILLSLFWEKFYIMQFEKNNYQEPVSSDSKNMLPFFYVSEKKSKFSFLNRKKEAVKDSEIISWDRQRKLFYSPLYFQHMNPLMKIRQLFSS